ncbi:geminin coiled-coil domain-containing protein 1 [Scomber scombrus]|uniref:Geminin coiled-coil domain-containing protein 1 n=1 Tax=Scomber scombrus TaxID=13677 RepID=A0AAV1QHS8_SCOSC
MLQHLARGPDTVDVSMETLASLWARDPTDPCDLIALEEERHEPSSVWEAQCVLNCSPPAAGLMWTEQLSPHLQRNKQLQDTLLQREEELVRLQDENNKLREFLNSSFVRNLEEKAKKLTADGRKKLKRNLMYVSDGPLHGFSHHHHHHHHHLSSQQVSKRVCRNLTAEFCSDFSEPSDATSSEPNLDLWVLRTLGLKDRDTIDTSNDSSSSSGFSLGGLVYDTSVTSSSSEYSSTRSCVDPAISNSASNCSSPPDQRSDFTSCGLSRRCDAPAALISSYNSITAFNSPVTGETPDICLQRPEGSPADPSAYWSPLKLNRTPSQDTIQFSPPAEGVFYSPISSSSPVVKQTWRPMRSRSPLSPSAGSQPPATPQTPRSRTDLAFSMCLSPSSSVKTHSFPQGQAFVRKDNKGRWNFTWLPRQGP